MRQFSFHWHPVCRTEIMNVPPGERDNASIAQFEMALRRITPDIVDKLTVFVKQKTGED